MGRPSKTKVLRAWMNGVPVGTWTMGPTGGYEFIYDEKWLILSDTRPISLSLPLRTEAYKDSRRVRAYFDNLLPDNALIKQRIQAKFKTASTSSFDLLAEIGRDCVGAIQLLSDDSSPADVRAITGTSVNEEEIEQLLNNVVSMGDQPSDDDFRISIAGAQEKTALVWHQDQWLKPHGATPTTHIFKLPIDQSGQPGIDLTTSVENEWLCEQILREYGVETSRSAMMQFGSRKVLVVERFDRKFSKDGSWIVRLPQEDFCQATGTLPGLKYENDGGPGIGKIMQMLLGSSAADKDRLDFFKTQIIFWMLCAIDGHAKNFSVFIEAGGRYRMTPRYDVLSAYPVLGHGANKLSFQKVKMAMALSGKNRHYRWDEILPRHFIETGRQCGLPEDVPTLIQSLVEATPAVIRKVESRIPTGFPASVSETILTGLAGAAIKLDSTPTGTKRFRPK